METVSFKEGSYGFFAEKDYEDLQFVLTVKPLRCRMVCLLCYQCIEKYLKHIARLDGEELRGSVLTTYSLVGIAERVSYPGIEKYRQELLFLEKFYRDGRYPNESERCVYVEPVPAESRRVAEVVCSVRDWVYTELQASAEQVIAALNQMDSHK